jgi:hypothetical protein
MRSDPLLNDIVITTAAIIVRREQTPHNVAY